MKQLVCLLAIALLCQASYAQNVFPESGNVGIGSSSPQAKLHVRGDIRFERTSGGNNYIEFTGDSGGNYVTTGDPGSNMKNLLIRVSPTNDNSTDRHLFFQTGKVNGAFQTRLFINGNGRIGIGTTTPKERLSVNGKIRAHEIKVEIDNWPDYVFQKDYQLRPLSEIECYIKRHGHLPEVPKAADVETDGVSLGEMNKLLLKKVEELTLHAIEQQKNIEKLERTVETLLKTK